MTIVKRLRLLTAALGVAAASAVVGTTVFGDVRSDRAVARHPGPAGRRPAVADESAKTKYTDVPALTYKLGSGETVFAWQVKPTLPAGDRPAPRRAGPGGHLRQPGRRAARAGPATSSPRWPPSAGADDRIDVWTVNINNPAATRSLTGGFQPADAEPVHAAVAKLAEAEYGSGRRGPQGRAGTSRPRRSRAAAAATRCSCTWATARAPPARPR